jgi:hypothetical protein
LLFRFSQMPEGQVALLGCLLLVAQGQFLCPLLFLLRLEQVFGW